MSNPITRTMVPASLRKSIRRRKRHAAKEKLRRGMLATDPGKARGPDFLIPGVQRGGSTALYMYLTEHPAIEPALFKEIHFFDQRYAEGLLWYRRHFPSTDDAERVRRQTGLDMMTGESSPYYLFHPLAPGRIAESLPRIRSVIVLRDPVARAYSHYHHAVSLGWEKRTFEEAIDLEPERLAGEVERIVADPGYDGFRYRHFSYVARGEYVDQLDRWFGLFPREDVLLVKGEDLFADPVAGLNAVFGFLGLPPHTPDAFPRYNKGTAVPMDPRTRGRLEERFAAANERLFAGYGIDYRSRRLT